MIDIIDIEKDSIADELGIKPGAKLISINGQDATDNLDYRFYTSGEEVEMLVEQDGERIAFEIEKDYQEDVGLILEDLTMRKCGNKCIFCFVHQSPKGLRRPLYFKDEDYRFSFLYGHYVTLTNTTQEDLDRIVRQRLTPLYISVHVTDLEMRKYMLGIKYDDYLLEKIDYLTSNGIELHCQIVLCPELNDGAYLTETLDDLKQFYPGVQSVAIVPVGLTKHRRNLPVLKPVTAEYAQKLITDIQLKRSAIKDELKTSFVYLSDEFFIRLNLDVPKNSYYEGFYQLENGVGLTRDFINNFKEETDILKKFSLEADISFVSGVLGKKVLEKYIFPDLAEMGLKSLRLHEVINHFYGETVVVSGLLVGQDIYNTLKKEELGDFVVLPPRVLNHDGLFLDDWTVDDLEKKIKKPVIIFPDSFTELFEIIREHQSGMKENIAKKRRHRIPEAYVVEHMKGGE